MYYNNFILGQIFCYQNKSIVKVFFREKYIIIFLLFLRYFLERKMYYYNFILEQIFWYQNKSIFRVFFGEKNTS
jgi:hypothetical protein